MLDIKRILVQIDEIEKNGGIITKVPLSKKRYAEAWKSDGRPTHSMSSIFYCWTPSGRSVKVEECTPDFEQDDSEFHFEAMVGIESNVDFVTNLEDVEICSMDDNSGAIYLRYKTGANIFKQNVTAAFHNWRNGKPSYCPPTVQQEPSYTKTCYCRDRVPVYMFTSAYWMCSDCKKDLGTLTEEEFKKNSYLANKVYGN